VTKLEHAGGDLALAADAGSPLARPLATGAWRLATGDWRLATGDWRLGDPGLETDN